MKEQLKCALAAVAQGDLKTLTEAAELVKQLPRTEEGLFDMTAVDSDCFEAAKWVYPVYAAFETECNKEAGYPDLLAQMRTLREKQKAAASVTVTAQFLTMLMTTIENVTPQLYEYYRELVDMFREEVKETITACYEEDAFGGAEGKASGADAQIRGAIARAGEKNVLLAEKYQRYVQEG